MKVLNKLKALNTLDRWAIAYKKTDKKKPLYKLDSIENLIIFKRKFFTVADPFIFCYDGFNYLFYEEQNLFTMKGKIKCVNLDTESFKSKTVLKKEYHLSYPYVFQYKKNIYMIPETKNDKKISLYRCINFPYQWDMTKKIIDAEAVDTTVLLDDDKWILFTFIDDRLMLYDYIEEKNIVKPYNINDYSSKSKIKRPAGSFIIDGDNLLRPVQDCQETYGGSIIFNCVEKIKMDQFSEYEKYRITPSNIKVKNYNIVGIHTYNNNEEYEVVDIKYRVSGIHIFIFNVILRVVWRINSFFSGDKGE